MKKVLIKVKDKSVLLQLKQFGDYETVSTVFNIYSMDANDKVIKDLAKISGVLKVEVEKYYQVQSCC